MENMDIVKIVKRTVYITNKVFATLRSIVIHRKFKSQFKSYIIKLGWNCNEVIQGEEQYKNKWSQLSKRVEPYSYRLFSKYCGANSDIIPEDIGHSIIEEILNPREHRQTYEDKNLFHVFIGEKNLPKTILYRINGGGIQSSTGKLVDEQYLSELPSNYTELILKPTVGSCSGVGVEKYIRKNDGLFYNINSNNRLSLNYLRNYNINFCLQEAVVQSPEMSFFNSSSVNTIRLAVYRSVKTEEVVVTCAVVRIGRNGAFIDNAHGGGRFVGIDIKNGRLANHTLDQFGYVENIWNGIDYSCENYTIPNWIEVLNFAKYIGKCLFHHRFIALDIALDINNKPILIEYNVSNFGYWVFMFVGQLPFGEYTDEIIEYCKKQKNQILL